MLNTNSSLCISAHALEHTHSAHAQPNSNNGIDMDVTAMYLVVCKAIHMFGELALEG